MGVGEIKGGVVTNYTDVGEPIDPRYDFSDRFADAPIERLIGALNAQVGNAGWVRAKQQMLAVLYREFLRKDVDCSSFINGRMMSLEYPIALQGNRIVQLKPTSEA